MKRAWLGVLAAGVLGGWAVGSRAVAPQAAARGAGVGTSAAGLSAALPEHIEFNRDIRPIVSNNCFLCHGPDHEQRKAKLRLDRSDDAYAPHKHGTPIVPGDPAKSEIVQRTSSHDPDEMMPPPTSEKKLTPRQIALLRKWVEQGGKYEKHWAFMPPVRHGLPEVKDAKWCRNAIDRFILARLEGEGLAPAPEADKATLCRRLYLDLLGLPPTPGQIDAFVKDARPDAYEKLVDQLLANPHYGERMALDWLDAARYADTHGYHIDSGRDQTRWREWVIDAYNKNMPFDEFTVEQLAGDLLPNSTDEQKIATGFVRNNMINFEGGAIPEEYLSAYIRDRVNTTSTVWLGLTLNCCQCHDHKFDPFTQKDYYSMYAFFNAVPENGLDGNHGNAAPVLATPTKAQSRELEAIAAKTKQIESQLAGDLPAADAEQAKWEKSATVSAPVAWKTPAAKRMTSRGGATLATQPDGSIVVSGANPPTDAYTIVASPDLPEVTAIRLETLPDQKLNGHGPGRSNNGNFVLTKVRISVGAADDSSIDGSHPDKSSSPERTLKIKSAWADFSQDTFPVSSAIGVKFRGKRPGWAIYPRVGQPHEAIFELEQPIHLDSKSAIAITLSFDSQFSQHQPGRCRLSFTDAKHPSPKDSLPANVRQALAVAAEKRTDGQKAEIRRFYREHVNAGMQSLREELAKLDQQKKEIEKHVPTTMVMKDMAHPRDTFILIRGQYDKHGQKVSADVPESLAPLPAGAPHNRLGLAEWIVSPKQPLTSRVVVNRLWQSFFGTGIVKTVEDFGSQGEEPTHPELLDWLAVEFMNPSEPGATKWDVKRMVKLLVTSSTYRQSTSATPAMIARDPEDRLLAHYPRLRLQAEFIRDQALAVSGLLNDEIGGKSVFPYQPAGLWSELMSRSDGANWTAQVYVQDHGKDLYRRTMYTFWKRTSPPPALSTFDAPDRETCTVRRSRTNTPLQALVLENDPTYVEASRKLAEHMMNKPGLDDDGRIAFAFRACTGRAPKPAEIAVLRKIHDRELAVYQKDPEAAKKLLSVGESPADPKLDRADLAAWSTVASVILNLDETISKG